MAATAILTTPNWAPAGHPGADNVGADHVEGNFHCHQHGEFGRCADDHQGSGLAVAANAEFDVTLGASNLGGISLADAAVLAFGARWRPSTIFDNRGTVAIASTGTDTKLTIAGDVTLSGNGHVTLIDDSHNAIVSDGNPASLTNAGNTITGAGTIGDANLTLDNQAKGVIEATGSSNALTIDAFTFNNEGKLEAAGSGGLVLENTTLTNSKTGALMTLGTGSHIDLDTADISGGSLKIAKGTVVHTVNDHASTITGATITNAGNACRRPWRSDHRRPDQEQRRDTGGGEQQPPNRHGRRFRHGNGADRRHRHYGVRCRLVDQRDL